MSSPVAEAFGEFGLDLNMYDRTGTVVGRNLDNNLVAYDHTIDAFGGFLTASIRVVMSKSDVEWWFENGLGKRVKLTCQAGRVAWEGFVNETSIGMGSESERRGPLLDMCNRLWETYSPVNYDVSPSVTGSEVTLPYIEDTVSQGKYGILEKVLSGGTCIESMAPLAQQVALAETAYPKQAGTIALSGGKQAELTLECLGLVNWLYAFIYNNTGAGTTTLTAKMQAVLTAELNNYISSDFTKIYTNSTLVGVNEKQNRYGADIIKELVSLGDSTTPGARTLFGVYDDAIVTFAVAPTTLGYEHHLSWNNQSIRQYAGPSVPPWLVRPGKWLIVPDFMPLSEPGTLGQDVRTKFIESVRYTAPLSLDLSGGRLDRLSTLLSRITYTSGASGAG